MAKCGYFHSHELIFFFNFLTVGYDPGDALIPLSAIREQALKIEIYAKELVNIRRSEGLKGVIRI
jgi:hypothetical protein